MIDWRRVQDVDVITLGMAADDARRTATGTNRVTYLRVHTVSGADLSHMRSVPDAASELRLYETPESLDDAVGYVRALKQLAGPRRVVAFSMSEIIRRGWGVEGLRTLAASGLSDVAELPADLLDDLTGAVRALESAGLRPQRVTTSHPSGLRRVEILERVTEAFASSAGLRRYSPLPRVAPVDKPTTGYDDVRMVAMARLGLGATSIEVDWSLYGPKLAQVALTFGADHLDAVAADTDMTLGPRRGTVEDVERNIKAAGFEPSELRHVA